MLQGSLGRRNIPRKMKADLLTRAPLETGCPIKTAHSTTDVLWTDSPPSLEWSSQREHCRIHLIFSFLLLTLTQTFLSSYFLWRWEETTYRRCKHGGKNRCREKQMQRERISVNRKSSLGQAQSAFILLFSLWHTHVEKLESEVNRVVALDHISPIGFASNVSCSLCSLF